MSVTIPKKKSSAARFQAQYRAFRMIYYTIAWLQSLTALVCLVGQTTGIFFYDWAARHGLQEPPEEVGPSIVQVNRAYCTSDTLLYIPMLLSSAYGLFRKKRWSLLFTAASAGISSYWAITCAITFLFLAKSNIDGYTHDPSVVVWSVMGFYSVYGVLVLWFIHHYWDMLFVVMTVIVPKKKSYAANFQAQDRAFRMIYYTIAWLQSLTALVCLAGQTTGMFFYDWAARHDLQENPEVVGPMLVQVNIATCTSDTLLYIPMLLSSAYGLFRKKRWSLICTAASAGVSSYWAMVCGIKFMLLIKNNIDGYEDGVSVVIWGISGFYSVYGVFVLGFLYHYWDLLFVVTSK
ncbi:hypothetical protein ACHAXR_013401 [Thalassiosira sp. AJA248-18]